MQLSRYIMHHMHDAYFSVISTFGCDAFQQDFSLSNIHLVSLNTHPNTQTSFYIERSLYKDTVYFMNFSSFASS